MKCYIRYDAGANIARSLVFKPKRSAFPNIPLESAGRFGLSVSLFNTFLSFKNFPAAMFASVMVPIIKAICSGLENVRLYKPNRLVANTSEAGTVSVSIMETMIAVSHQIASIQIG